MHHPGAPFVPSLMRWPSKPTRRRWLAFLRTPLTPLVLVPLLYFDAWQLQDRYNAGFISYVLTLPFHAHGHGSYGGWQIAVIPGDQGGVRVLSNAQTSRLTQPEVDNAVAFIHFRTRIYEMGLWTLEVRPERQTLEVTMVDGDIPPGTTLESWVERWMLAKFLYFYWEQPDSLKEDPNEFAQFRKRLLGLDTDETVTAQRCRVTGNTASFAWSNLNVQWANVAHSMVALLAFAALFYSFATARDWRPRVLVEPMFDGLTRIFDPKAHRARLGRCTKCNYDLAGLTRCPECGERRQIETL